MHKSFFRIFSFFVILHCTTLPLYSQSPQEWAKKDGVVICGCCVLATILIGTHFAVPLLIKKYHENNVSQARQKTRDKKQIQSNEIDFIKSELSDFIKSQLADYKDTLISTQKTTRQTGISISVSSSFPGRSDITNAISFLNFELTGAGMVRSCFSPRATFYGNVIAQSCEFTREVTIEKDAPCASFDDCLIGKVVQKGKYGIIELNNCIVEDDIIFENNGIVIVDDKTLLCGTITNGKIVFSK